MESHILKSLKDIKTKFKTLHFSQSTEMYDFFSRLPEGKKEEYIKSFEIFFHTFNSFSCIFEDLLFIAKKLEKIKKERDKYIELTKKNPPAHFFSHGHFQDIAPLIRLFYNSITILVKIIEDNEILVPEDVKNKYQELHYVRLLRNNFVQHIKLEAGYQRISTSTIPSKSSKDLPDFCVGPGGGGWCFYTSYYQQFADTKRYVILSNKDKLKKNKENFINGKKFENINARNVLAQIKTYGLPKFDQKIFSQDLLKLFNDIIFPLLQEEIINAKKEKILF